MWKTSSFQNKITTILQNEERRQKTSINMIASSNIGPKLVQRMLGSVFMNVVAEGYRGKRYHTGTENYDALEQLGLELAQQVFGARYINLKPHSGTQATQAVLLALKQENRKKILAMRLMDGGHITHTNLTSFNRSMGFDFKYYGVTESFDLDYDEIRKVAKTNRAEVIIAGASAFPKTIDFFAFQEIGDEVGAKVVADVCHYTGLIAGGMYPNPCDCVDITVLSTSKTLPGPKGGIILTGKNTEGELEQNLNAAVNIGLQSEDIANAVAAKVQVLALTQHPAFRKYAELTVENAKHLSDCLHHLQGSVVGYDVTSHGTDSHIVLVNVKAANQSTNGHVVAEALALAGIYANKNLIPNDLLGVNETSGLRLSTSSVSILGMGKAEMAKIAKIIHRVIRSIHCENGNPVYDKTVIETSRREVRALRQAYQKTLFE